MKTPAAPKAPDPVATAAAQTGTNISTATANSILGNVNQVTPDGNLTYTTTGRQFIEDATGGQTYWRGPNGEIQTSAPTTTVSTPSAGGGRALTASEERGVKAGYITPAQADLIRSTGQPNMSPGGISGGASTSGPAAGWSQVKGYYIPQTTATQTLSPAQQAIKDQNDAASLNLGTIANQQTQFLGDYLGKGVDTSKLPAMQFGTGNVGNVQTSLPTAGGIQSDIKKTSGGIQYTIDPTTGQIQYGFGDAGAITKSYGTNDYSADRTKVEDAMYSRLNPQIDRQRAAEETRLQNQGVRVGSTAWASAMDDFNRGLNDQRTSIVLAGGQEQSRLQGLEQNRATFENAAQQQTYGQMLGRTTLNNDAQAQEFGQNATRATFNNAAQAQEYGQNANDAAFHNSSQDQGFSQDLQGATFANTAQQQIFGQGVTNVGLNNSGRQQAISETYAARNQPINEISALMAGSQVGTPNFVPTNQPTIPTVDYAGLVQQNYQSQMDAYKAKLAQSQSMMGGLFGLGSSLIAASDRRLKTDIRRVGQTLSGLAIYAFRYIWGGPMYLGLMAQEVAKAMPGAVVELANGFLAVDYGKALRPEAA